MASQSDQKKNEARLKREQAQAAAAAAAKRNRNLQALAAVVFAAIVVVVGIVAFTGGKGESAGIGSDDEAAVAGVAETKTLLAGLTQEGLTLGDPKAPVTIVEFIDVQCPFCKEHQLDQQPKIIKELVRTGKARLTLAPMALSFMGEDSEAGRTVLERLGAKNKGWNFANLFFFNQGQEQTGYVTNAFLKKLAIAAGGTAADATPREPSGEIATTLAEVDALSEALRVTGTPSFAIGKTTEDPKDYKLVTLNGTDSTADQVIKATDAVGGV